VWYDPASGLTANSQPSGPHDIDQQPTTTEALVVAGDGPVMQNGGGDGVATAAAGPRQRSVELPSA